MTSIAYDDLIAEKEVYDRYGDKLVKNELLDARKAGLIEFVRMRRGIFYTEEQLSAYISSQVVEQCPRASNDDQKPAPPPKKSSDSENTGSAGKKDGSGCTVTGMTPELEKRAAERLSQRLGNKPN